MCVNIVKPILRINGIQKVQKNGLNKAMLEKIKQNFIKNQKSAEDIILKFAEYECEEREQLCSDFDLFSGKNGTSMGAGSADIRALCLAVATAYQPRNARHYSTKYLIKIRKIIEKKDIEKLVDHFQSINRSAKANLKLYVNTETELKINLENKSNNFWANLPDHEDEEMVRAGNKFKVRLRNKRDKKTGNLFDLGSVA